MKERLHQYALLAEIISAAAIVCSLVFVGLQVRQGAEETAASSRAIQGSMRQSMLETDVELLLATFDAPFLARPPQGPLSQEQSDQLFVWVLTYVRTRETYWLQFRNSLLDAAAYESYMSSMTGYIAGSSEASRIWQDIVNARVVTTEGYIDEVNQRIAGFTAQAGQ